MAKKILIIGAGYSGVEAALALHKKSRKDDVEIVLVDKNPYHTLLTELHEVAGNRISEDGVIVPLQDIFKYTKVKTVIDEIDEIDFENKKAVSKMNEYHYDYLVLATGSSPTYYGINGLKEHGFTLWSFEDAIKIREHIKHCFLMAAQEPNFERRSALLTFCVGGGGFTGVEMMGEISQWVKKLCKDHGIHRSEVKLIMVEALPGILQNLRKKNVHKVMNYLTKKLKVDVLLNHAISNVTRNHIEMNGEISVPTKTLIWCAGIKSAPIIDKIELEKEKSRIKVDEYAETVKENVYVVGDSCAFLQEHHALPALVETALQTGKGAAKNILLDIRGKEKEKVEPKLHGVVVSVGCYYAVGDIMGFQLPVPISMLMKYLINVHYLFGIGGFELIAKYLRHEFFDKQQKKNIIEQHYSVKSHAFWMVPLRLLLGYVWLVEGIGKVNAGWLREPVLAGLAKVSTGSSASLAEGGKAVFRIVTTSTPDWYAWIANTFVIPNAFFFQVIIVIAEIGLGLAFISGSFNFIAGLVSLGLIVNFMLSSGFYETNWWYIPAAICMMGGAGRAFGLDYYIMPYLMRQWRYFTRNKRIKIWLKK